MIKKEFNIMTQQSTLLFMFGFYPIYLQIYLQLSFSLTFLSDLCQYHQSLSPYLSRLTLKNTVVVKI